MIEGPVTFVRALRDFFGEPQITTDQLKALSDVDKAELRQMLIEHGYDIQAVPPPPQS